MKENMYIYFYQHLQKPNLISHDILTGLNFTRFVEFNTEYEIPSLNLLLLLFCYFKLNLDQKLV